VTSARGPTRGPFAAGPMADASAGRDLRATRAFFAPRAQTWDERFPDDEAAFAAAVEAMELKPGAVVVDVGCGTGRAAGALDGAVGRAGTVVALDVTPEMLHVAREAGRGRAAALVLGDAARLPFRDAAFDGVFAAGLLTHLDSPIDGLRGFAAATRVGGVLALFHPIGRAALAAGRRHSRGREPRTRAGGERLAADDLRRRRRSLPRVGPPYRSNDDVDRRAPAISLYRRAARA
jgi:SAM-dependent methyltransferase